MTEPSEKKKESKQILYPCLRISRESFDILKDYKENTGVAMSFFVSKLILEKFADENYVYEKKEIDDVQDSDIQKKE